MSEQILDKAPYTPETQVSADTLVRWAGSITDHDVSLGVIEGAAGGFGLPPGVHDIETTAKGEAFDAGSGWIINDGGEPLMRELGFVVESNDDDVSTITAAPTPDTLYRSAQEFGVDIQFFTNPDTMYIKGPDYLKAFADKKYPVSFGHYKHDIEDDHLTGVVLGGEPLKSALSEVATAALAGGDKAVRQTTDGIDIFTNMLRDLTLPRPNPFVSEDSLIKLGNQMGIATDKIDTIIKTARDRATKLESQSA